MLSLSSLPQHTCSVSVPCPHLPPFFLGPCDWLFDFFRCQSQKQEKLPATAAHPPAADVLPQVSAPRLCGALVARSPSPLTPLTGLSCLYRPARMVPSITHGLILSVLASSRESEPANLPGESSSPPRGRLPGALPVCWHPSSGHCLVCFPGPKEKGREGKREAAGEGERGRKGRGLHL